VIQVREGIALVLREIRLRTNDETLTFQLHHLATSVLTCSSRVSRLPASAQPVLRSSRTCARSPATTVPACFQARSRLFQTASCQTATQSPVTGSPLQRAQSSCLTQRPLAVERSSTPLPARLSSDSPGAVFQLWRVPLGPATVLFG